jgi:putative aldouronate transport system permease protein
VRRRLDLYDVVVYSISFLIVLVIAIPVLHVITLSLEPEHIASRTGEFHVLPTKGITLGAYEAVLSRPAITRALFNSAFVTIVSGVLGVVVTGMFAYAITIKGLPGRRVLTFLAVFTMAFHLGIIPRYLLLRDIGLLNTLWALILPPLVWASNMIIMRAFFMAQPPSLRESAYLDGANEITIFFRIVIPISMSIIATIFLFYAVTRWNSYLDAVIFISSRELKVIQVLLREVLIEFTSDEDVMGSRDSFGTNLANAIAIVSIVPIAIVYPFLQRYFVKGSLVGAVKG